MQRVIATFGEAEKGKFHVPYFCHSLEQLSDYFGNPPEDSLGLHFAVQALMYEQYLIFFRVQEEGFGKEDYYLSFRHLEKREEVGPVDALCLPGVGDKEIIDKTQPLCFLHRSFLITTEKDLYDYLSSIRDPS